MREIVFVSLRTFFWFRRKLSGVVVRLDSNHGPRFRAPVLEQLHPEGVVLLAQFFQARQNIETLP